MTILTFSAIRVNFELGIPGSRGSRGARAPTGRPRRPRPSELGLEVDPVEDGASDSSLRLDAASPPRAYCASWKMIPRV